MDLNSFLKPVIKECYSYSYRDFNKISYHRMMAIVNGDFLVNVNIAIVLGLNVYPLISNDVFWK